jgi:hypothetical protein
MAANQSRVRMNSLRDYLGAELKQGGVLLDADVNELVAILDRRLRALAGDVLGRATVGANTPDAFKITLGPGGLSIGRGRLYVDGLLAENHGTQDPAQREFDDLLAETRFTSAVSYDAQPYLPVAPPLPEAGRHLVYLDVWQREVTHLEQPDLVETAVGVETSSRLQTAWQVRVLGDEAGASTTCGSPDAELTGWADLIAPSTGRLTTGTYEVSAVTDPCELPPTGGYRGLENQLYRVEIHDAGQPDDTATFTWSRENASVGSRVASIVSATELELESLGRDDVLRFNSEDWVEIIDDAREFQQERGEMRKISVEEATRRISFSPALPNEMLPASFPDSAHPKASNLRVLLWNQRGRILRTTGSGDTALHQDLDASGSTGVIKVPAAGTTLLLENGVTVSFSTVGPKGFRAGDFWVFAARTADASVELLDAAPPRGIHHHYARLALWDASSTAEPTDCRHPWPPRGGEDCSCTECVTPESHANGQLTIEAAVARVKDTGGTVCLHAGQYTLRGPVIVNGAHSVRIKGQGPATILIAPSGAFRIESSSAIVIEQLTILSLGRLPAIAVRTTTGAALQELLILVAGGVDARASAIALSGVVAALMVRDNLISAPEGIRALDPTDEGAPTFLITASLGIEHNILSCQRQAISLAGTVGHLFASRICGNQVLGSRDGAINVLGLTVAGGSMRIADNDLNVNGSAIRCAVDGAWIEDNKINAVAQGDRQPIGSGISLVTGLDPNGSDQCQVLANQVRGFPDAGILIEAPARDLIVKLNIIEDCGNGIVMVDAASAGSLSIENNHLRNIGAARAGGVPAQSISGIRIFRTQAATVAGNTLRQIGLNAVRGTALIVGIASFAVQRTRIVGNEITEMGPSEDIPGVAVAGILVGAPYAQTEIHNNHVERDAQPSDRPSSASWTAVAADRLDVQRPAVNLATYTAVRVDDARTFVMHGNRAFIDVSAVFTNASGAIVVRGSSAAVRGNVMIARGAAPAVSVLASGEVQFGDNHCELRGGAGVAPVLLGSSAAIVNSNLVRGGRDRSMAISASIKRVTIVGNATTAEIFVDGNPLQGTLWGPLNIAV